MNGPAVFQIEKEDMVIVVAYAQIDSKEIATHQPTVIFPKEGNKL
jgi:aspartate 1-decarboxylase